jgi:hypothetical protein
LTSGFARAIVTKRSLRRRATLHSRISAKRKTDQAWVKRVMYFDPLLSINVHAVAARWVPFWKDTQFPEQELE